MTVLTDQQRQELLANQGSAVPVVDEQTQKVYYLVPAEQFEQLRAMLASEAFDVREIYPLISKTAAAAGWADPLMDDYDRYDESRANG